MKKFVFLTLMVFILCSGLVPVSATVIQNVVMVESQPFDEGGITVHLTLEKHYETGPNYDSMHYELRGYTNADKVSLGEQRTIELPNQSDTETFRFHYLGSSINGHVVILQKGSETIEIKLDSETNWYVFGFAGDLNGDGQINSTDCTIMKRYVMKTSDWLPIFDHLKAGDLDGNGQIDSTDLTILKRYLLKIIDIFPGQTPA